jgi:hypothetical protein
MHVWGSIELGSLLQFFDGFKPLIILYLKQAGANAMHACMHIALYMCHTILIYGGAKLLRDQLIINYFPHLLLLIACLLLMHGPVLYIPIIKSCSYTYTHTTCMFIYIYMPRILFYFFSHLNINIYMATQAKH